MEHFNNEMKKATNAMGANKTPKAIQRISRASAGMEAVGKTMDTISFVPKCSSAHAYKSTANDEKALIQVVHELKPFDHASREHSKFKDIRYSMLDRLDMNKASDWIRKSQKKLCKHPLYKTLYNC